MAKKKGTLLLSRETLEKIDWMIEQASYSADEIDKKMGSTEGVFTVRAFSGTLVEHRMFLETVQLRANAISGGWIHAGRIKATITLLDDVQGYAAFADDSWDGRIPHGSRLYIQRETLANLLPYLEALKNLRRWLEPIVELDEWIKKSDLSDRALIPFLPADKLVEYNQQRNYLMAWIIVTLAGFAVIVYFLPRFTQLFYYLGLFALPAALLFITLLEGAAVLVAVRLCARESRVISDWKHQEWDRHEDDIAAFVKKELKLDTPVSLLKRVRVEEKDDGTSRQ